MLTKLSLIFLSLIICSADLSSESHKTLIAGTQPSFSPDGQKIAFEHGRHIWSMNLENGKASQKSTQKWDFAPMWSPDGNKIVFQSYGKPKEVWQGKFSIWVMDANGSNQHQLIKPDSTGGDQYPVWSPNGKLIVWTHGKQLWIMNENGTNAHPLTSKPAKEYEFAACWSPDGRTIAYLGCQHSPDYQIWLIDSSGDNQRPLGITACYLKWSHKDNYIYYSTGSELLKIHPGATEALDETFPFFNPQGNSIQEFDISPDGQWVVYADPGDDWEGFIYISKLK